LLTKAAESRDAKLKVAFEAGYNAGGDFVDHGSDFNFEADLEKQFAAFLNSLRIKKSE